jgi:cell wall-associated NlpC family hydrolase
VPAAYELADNGDLIREALRNRGTPYVWGGSSRGGFDCSGFVLYVYRKKRGIMLPHHAADQARLGVAVAREELQPGDLVFFTGTYRRGISHVAIYIGNNQIVHAASHMGNVRIDSLTGYYARRYYTARRLTAAPMRLSPQELREMIQDPSEPPPAE